MFKTSTKLLFFFFLINGSLIAISANSWLGAWIGLEINLLSFIPLMTDNNNLMSSEAALKYFLTQALASALLLFSIIIFMLLNSLYKNLEFYNNFTMLMISSSLLLKNGAAPFHFWLPGVMEGLTWLNGLILMTWQKIAPLMLISYCFINNFIIIIIIFSILLGSLGGLNQTSLRKILAFSSINHLGWMLAAMLCKNNLWELYFIFYCLLNFLIVNLFNIFKLFHINQVFSISFNPLIKFSLFTSLLSLGGLPPFLGFMPKWLVIQSLTMNNFLFLMIVMVCLTLITLYFYIRICYSAFLLTYSKTNWNMFFNLNNLTNWILIISLNISIFGLIFMNFFYFIY
uniref:NADH-ubiquinone oxidoreductase chain 2 n=1 Tax=Epiphragma mediale TaxID=2804209 RepID=A0A7U0FL01_9DIPT|nr:NADH dehydrogenase subunit 2 [Epiphragma mediale]QQV67796.1 NADH dehydrogenase subunit 2 [Epiphragma mediale]